MRGILKIALIVAPAAGAIVLAACATSPAAPPNAEIAQRAAAMMKRDFAKLGPKWVARIDQDEAQSLCTAYRDTPPPEVAAKIRAAQLATIRFPASGRLMGDWKSGAAIAALARGLQFSDPPGEATGGNCYACHQLSTAEIAYGNIGPSLHNFGKLRGNSEDIVRYTYGKIYNAEAYAACSNMPRFGHNKILTPEQIADLVALLLDPVSPVNQ
jgi:L-cysteine S-thiosulfotransferase